MAREHLGPNADAQVAAAQAAGIGPIGDETPDLLKGRGVNFIGFNEVANEVVVFTSKVVSKKLRKTLPQHGPNGVTIAYQVGFYDLVGKLPPSPYGTMAAELHNGRYKCGGSIHVGNRISAGTLGCLVRDAAGEMYGLTNNHVSGNCNYASVGLPILAPGPVDVSAGGVDPFCIGHHYTSLRMVHGAPDNPNVQHPLNTDAALFKIADQTKVTSLQKDNSYDTPAVVGAITPGMTVTKVGRTTGRTGGVVRAQISGPYMVRYKMAELEIDFAVFYEPIFVVQPPAGSHFSLGGDSGSLVTTLDANNQRLAVGLVFAGDGTNSFILPLQPIVQALGVTLVSGHNV